jgi:menaquinone-dependent protoporphyrinogen IX oxidase
LFWQYCVRSPDHPCPRGFYFQEQIVKFVVMKRGGAASTAGDREFTDWNALAGFVDGFLEKAV